ncbi:MAG: hypothetical protein K6F33_04040 [Bacteroidales bacterium]|nr:hypothetical protein [Bacteroidales bacterium]
MKKFAKILFAVSFSIFLLIIGGGIGMVKCIHSGKYKISLSGVEIESNFSCNPEHGCMQKDFIKFSPDANQDFQHLVINDAPAMLIAQEFFLHPDVLQSVNAEYLHHNNYMPPPKAVYKFIQVFRI